MIERGNLDDPKHKWLYGKPDYSVVNLEYLKNRTQSHAADSLEKIVENLVKTWEMETQHKDSAYFQILDDLREFLKIHIWVEYGGFLKIHV